MAKLYFKYGAMGSSKSAQALITKYNYEERGMKVWLIKPKTDTRDGASIIKSRIGLYAEAEQIGLEDSIKNLFAMHKDCNVIIADEAQFLAPEQIDELRDIVDDNGKVVTSGDQICLGGNDRYIAMCHKCWKKAIAEQK